MPADVSPTPESENSPPSQAPPAFQATNRPRRIWPKALVVALALVAIASASYYVISQLPETPPQQKGEQATAGGSAASPAFHSRFVFTKADDKETDGPKVGIAALGRLESASLQEIVPTADPRRLINEIVRQAILMTAHDHFGAITRDSMIGEASPPPSEKATLQAEIAWTLAPNNADSKLTIKTIGGKQAEPLVVKLPTGDLTTNPTAVAYSRVLTGVEQAAREELPKAFKGLGMEGSPIVVKTEGALPAEIKKQLATLTFTEQFAALREINALIRTEGESPERLGCLIRCYAQLGVLTEYHWNPSHDSFKARALLAAQRWVAREPRSADALRHRAFAFVFAGLPRFAIDDLASAKALGVAGEPASDWVSLLEFYCNSDTKNLLATKPGSSRDLALLLAFLTLEGSTSRVLTIEVGQKLLSEIPECYRVHDGVSAAGGISVLHEATAVPLAIFANEVPRRLRQMKGLPNGIAATFVEAADEAAAVKILGEAGRSTDRGEPSWGALAQMMEETCFVQVARRARFLAFQLGVSAEGFVAATRSMVADHVFCPYVDTFAVDTARDISRFRDLIASIKFPVVDIDVNETNLFFDTMAMFDQGRSQSLFQEASLRQSGAEHDMKLFLPRIHEGSQLKQSKFLLDVSPRSPIARSMHIQRAWPEVEKEAVAWEAEDNPEILLSLGWRYIMLKRWDDAKRCLERCVSLSGDSNTYKMLAQVFKQQNDWKGWQQTLDRFLATGQDVGLDRASVQTEIADYLMRESRWKEAEPYAASAAESWSAFGMTCAMNCYEGEKDWKNAEIWARRLSERYPDQQWMTWFLFCKRTEHGDVEAAERFTSRYVDSVGHNATGVNTSYFAFFHLMTGRQKEALEFFDKLSGDQLVLGVCYSALIHDSLGNAKERDACFERLTTDPACTANTKSTPIYKIYRAAVAENNATRVDLSALAKELTAIPDNNRDNVKFHVAWFLHLHGFSEQSKTYLEQTVTSKTVYAWIGYAAKEAQKNPSRIFGKPGVAPKK